MCKDLTIGIIASLVVIFLNIIQYKIRLWRLLYEFNGDYVETGNDKANYTLNYSFCDNLFSSNHKIIINKKTESKWHGEYYVELSSPYIFSGIFKYVHMNDLRWGFQRIVLNKFDKLIFIEATFDPNNKINPVPYTIHKK
ncbi:MAG: hypothetical protein NTW49_12530 [Bacteroidia bacterium]|nr:hypothetical protein [Bacteroidia bacterium]